MEAVTSRELYSSVESKNYERIKRLFFSIINKRSLLLSLSSNSRYALQTEWRRISHLMMIAERRSCVLFCEFFCAAQNLLTSCNPQSHSEHKYSFRARVNEKFPIFVEDRNFDGPKRADQSLLCLLSISLSLSLPLAHC